MVYNYLDLNMSLSKEDELFKRSVREFAQKELRQPSLEIDKMSDPRDVVKENSIFWKVLKKMRIMDYHTALIPQDLGGLGLSPLQFHIFLEEISVASVGLALISVVDCFPALLAVKSGRKDLIDEFVVPYVEDNDAKITGCWCATEPDVGSDLVLTTEDNFSNPDIHFETTGVLKGDTYIVNGQKSAWVSNGPAATCAVFYANISPGKGLNGTGSFIIPLDLEGISKGPALDKIGQRDLPQGEFFFDNAHIPEKYLIFPPELFRETFAQTLTLGNTSMATAFTGLARAAFEEALTYAKGRVQGGKVICRHQLIQKKLFDMFMKVETARAISRSVMIYNLTQPIPSLEHAIVAKVYCTEAALEVASEAIQILGGYGLTKEFPVEKFYRDARASLIEDGINEVLSLDAFDLILKNYK
jgi:alkylation response protein AidB-like acyl-CoA dehydrogenase